MRRVGLQYYLVVLLSGLQLMNRNNLGVGIGLYMSLPTHGIALVIAMRTLTRVLWDTMTGVTDR